MLPLLTRVARPKLAQNVCLALRMPVAPSRTLITKRFTKEHESVTFDDGTGVGTITITDYAQKSLGDVVFVELPSAVLDREVEQIGAVESVKAASDIYSPVTGVVSEINEQLQSDPGLLNKSPEQDGWLCKIEVSDANEISKLMDEKAYGDFLASESH